MADKLAGIGQYKEVDPAFTAVKPSAETLRLAKLNAAPGQTAEEYLASRGGVNASGYYGDSWSSSKNLTDAEFAAVMNQVRSSGGTGVAFGSAINAAQAKKQYDEAIRLGIDPTKAAADYNAAVSASNAANGTSVPLMKDASGNPIDPTKTSNVSGVGGNTNYSGGGTTADPLKLNGSPFTGNLGGVNYVSGVKEDTAKRTAQQEFRSTLAEFGLADLADEVDNFIRNDYSVSQIKLELPKTQSYKSRFPGMESLRAAGQAINEATYISMERGYLQTLAAYGIDTTTLGSRKQLGTYISNLVSPREFEERVNLAATRVKDNADVIAQFKTYYPEVDNAALTAYLLNPMVGMDIIKKQVRLAEIGAAAMDVGFATGVSLSTAEELRGAVGEQDYQTIRSAFGQAKVLADQQSRLARIEGTNYSQNEAIQGIVGRDIQSQMASQKRAERETMTRFGGRSGVTSTSLRDTNTI